MPYLLLQEEYPPQETVVTTRIGGWPLAPRGTSWPTCTECGGPMQFLAQIDLRPLDELDMRDMLLLFQCQNQPGQCREWEPDSGGNCAMLVDVERAELLQPPRFDDTTLLPKIDGIKLTPYGDSGNVSCYFDAKSKNENEVVLGQIGGLPDWIQGEEAPICCSVPMECVVQLENNGGGGINFGDAGCGYGFVCGSCKSEVRFLWQCA